MGSLGEQAGFGGISGASGVHLRVWEIGLASGSKGKIGGIDFPHLQMNNP